MFAHAVVHGDFILVHHDIVEELQREGRPIRAANLSVHVQYRKVKSRQLGLCQRRSANIGANTPCN